MKLAKLDLQIGRGQRVGELKGRLVSLSAEINAASYQMLGKGLEFVGGRVKL